MNTTSQQYSRVRITTEDKDFIRELLLEAAAKGDERATKRLAGFFDTTFEKARALAA